MIALLAPFEHKSVQFSTVSEMGGSRAVRELVSLQGLQGRRLLASIGEYALKAFSGAYLP